MAGNFGRFGNSVKSLAKSEFFRWFNLKLVGQSDDGLETTYRPAGYSFRHLVSLIAQADSSRAIERLTLCVSRNFIEDDRQSPFALDAVRSYLESLTSSDTHVRPLLDEIANHPSAGPVLTTQTLPRLADTPSPEYLTIVGKADFAQIKLKRLTISLQNHSSEMPHLSIQAVVHEHASTSFAARIFHWLARIFGN